MMEGSETLEPQGELSDLGLETLELELLEAEKPLTLKQVQALLVEQEGRWSQRLSGLQAAKDRQLAEGRRESQEAMRQERQHKQQSDALLEEAFGIIAKAGKDVFPEEDVSAVKNILNYRQQLQQQETSSQQAWADETARRAYYSQLEQVAGQRIVKMITKAGLDPKHAVFGDAHVMFKAGYFDAAYGMIKDTIEEIKEQGQLIPSVTPDIEEKKAERKEAYRGVDTGGAIGSIRGNKAALDKSYAEGELTTEQYQGGLKRIGRQT